MTEAPFHKPAGRLEVPSTVLAGLHAAARGAWPAECCGLLVGIRSEADGLCRVHRAVASPNVAQADGTHGRHDRFEIDPVVLLATQRAARAEGLAVIGHYHSHPNAPAVPSPTDLAHAFYADHVWLIVSVDAAGHTTATAWQPVLPAPTTPATAFLPMPLDEV